jgi:CheY-like chemotaxis protein
MPSSEFTVLFVTSHPERVARAQGFVRAARVLSAGALTAGDLGVSSTLGVLVVVLHLASENAAPGLRNRLEFWAGRSGGAAAWNSSGSRGSESLLSGCNLRHDGVAPAEIGDVVDALLRVAGLATEVSQCEPRLDLDLGGLQGDGIRYDADAETLFLPSVRAPPLGDVLALRITPPTPGKPAVAAGAVSAVLPAGHAGAGSPPGFLVRVTRMPPEARAALLAHCAVGRPRRAAPRFRVALRAHVVGAFETSREDLDARVQSLSQGGAFVRSSREWRIGERVRIAMDLPWGARFVAHAVVVRADDRGAGIRFELEAEGEAVLADVLERITARPRSAIVVDDDALARRMIGDALQERGFTVRAAQEGRAGMHILSEHLLETDLLVTDLRMPAMNGETFIRTIRSAGGERDLAILGMTASWDAETAARLRAAGAEAILDKALGPEIIARASEAIVAARVPPDIGFARDREQPRREAG